MKYISDKERKYRSKIIAENHLKKKYQMGIDRYIDCSYKELYCNKGKLMSLISIIAAIETCEIMGRFGDTVKNTAKAFRKLSKALASAH